MEVKKLADIILKGYTVSKDSIFANIKRQGKLIQFSYSNAVEMVKSIGGFLKSKGFNAGDRAAIIGENCPEWCISYFGIQWAGGICVPLDSKASQFEIKQFLEHSETKFIFVSEKNLNSILEIKEDLRSLEGIIAFPEGRDNIYSFSEVSSFNHKLEMAMDRQSDEPAVILYTSGTTGRPKAVMLSHKNIISNIESVLEIFDFNKNDRVFSVLPLHHIFEQTCGFLIPTYVGCKITYARSLKPDELLEDLRDCQPTVFLTVPLLLEKLYLKIQNSIRTLSLPKRLIFKTLDILNLITLNKGAKILFKNLREKIGFSKIRYLVSGGAALPEWVGRGFEKLGFPIYQGYGLSETSPVVSVHRPNQKRKIASVGPPIPRIKVKIFNPDEKGIGEIAVKGDSVMLGYYKDEELTKESFKDGWFLTGDLGFIDKDGQIHITGRKKSVIVTKGGRNIYPEEIEEKLSQSPLIKECVVVAKIHPKTKIEVINAIVYPDFEKIHTIAKQSGKKLTEQLVMDLIDREIDKTNKKLAQYKRISSFTIRNEEFPKTTTQKIKRYMISTQTGNLNE